MPPTRRRAWKLAKTAFGLAVIAGVTWHFTKTLSNPDLHLDFAAFQFHWLVPAGLLYLLTHTLWGTFWWQLLRDEEQPVTWRRSVATYFISQFAKYVPGKGWVRLLRVAALARRLVAKPPVAVTGIFETRTSMAAGALLGIATLPASGLKLPAEASKLWLFALIAGVPLGVAALMKIAQRVATARKGPDAPTLHAPSIRLLAQ